MEQTAFIITLTGPSQSGKTLIMDKIVQIGTRLNEEKTHFIPQKIKKYTTRHLRLNEIHQIENGGAVDVEFVKRIPESCDLVYQTYGIRYGLATKSLDDLLKKNISPIVVINDIRAVEEIRKVFHGQVLSLFLFRKIPEIEDFKEEARDRGNVSEQEIRARYEKAVAIYHTYIENICLFDHVILNAIEYLPNEVNTNHTILDLQLLNVIRPILQKQKMLKKESECKKFSRIFVIAGNAASGKDEIVRALLSMGKLEAKVLPKYTMRQQEPADGAEIICKYIPSEECLSDMRKLYAQQESEVSQALSSFHSEFKKTYKKEFINFKQQLEENIKDEFQRFWELITDRLSQSNDLSAIKNYFQPNPYYVDLNQIKSTARMEFQSHGVELYRLGEKLYIIYGDKDRLYGCDITNLAHDLEQNTHHIVIAASQIGVIDVLKHLYGQERVRFVYAHSEISVSEFEKNASDITKDNKKKEFKKILDNYTKDISDVDHVTIYAKATLSYEQTSKEEDLIDQFFRLLRTY